MTEPTSSTAAGIAGWKLIGGAAGVSAGAAGLAYVVVVCMRRPKTDAEWIVSLISTLVASIAGGSWLLHKLGMADLATVGPLGLAVLMGLCFVCGLPAWALVRAAFAWLAKRDGKDIGELATDAASDVASVSKGFVK